MQRGRSYFLALSIIGLIVAVYWPLQYAGLVWDDRFYLHDRAWLREGDAWLTFALHGLPNWEIYFRPLGVAFFTLQLRILGAAPALMHLTSLFLHLVSTALVGKLALEVAPKSAAYSRPFVYGCMLIYGFHPALIEPVAWISSQCDLLVAIFMLLGLLANIRVETSWLRCGFVASCFLLAAFSKESAVVFPPILFLFDWMISPDGLRAQLRRQLPIYVGVFCTGALYLAIRRWALGALIDTSQTVAFFSFAHFQEICLTYTAYLKLIIWPMAGLGPLHSISESQLERLDPTSFAGDVAAVAVAVSSCFLLWRRHPLGAALGIASVALLPTLHIIPIDFDGTLYHDRYALFAVAILCTWLPAIAVRSVAQGALSRRFYRAVVSIAGVVWLLFAALNIRVTLPLWSDELYLWRWALAQNPGSRLIQDALLATYVERRESELAAPLADRLMQIAPDCSKCMLNVAYLRLMQHDTTRAGEALEAADRAMRITPPAKNLVIGFALAKGNLEEQRNNPKVAEEAYRAAMRMDTLSPEATMNLALLKARTGEVEQAKAALHVALSLSPVDERARRQQEFDSAIHERAGISTQ